MPSLQNLERLVTDAIHKQFSKHSASEDELLEDIRAIFDSEAARPVTPATTRTRGERAATSEALSNENEDETRTGTKWAAVMGTPMSHPPLDLDPKLPIRTLKQGTQQPHSWPSSDPSSLELKTGARGCRSRPQSNSTEPSRPSALGGKRPRNTSTSIAPASPLTRSGLRLWGPS